MGFNLHMQHCQSVSEHVKGFSSEDVCVVKGSIVNSLLKLTTCHPIDTDNQTVAISSYKEVMLDLEPKEGSTPASRSSSSSARCIGHPPAVESNMVGVELCKDDGHREEYKLQATILLEVKGRAS